MVKIFVGRLAPCVSSLQLRELFEKYGPVSDCDILRDYGFVHMSHEADAQKAIRALDKYDLCGSRLSVELSTSRSMKSCQLIVKNLPKDIALEDVHKLFKKFGTVTLCKINKDNAIVHMRFPSMATNAVRNLSGETFRGNVLSVEFVNNATKQANDWTGQPRNGSSLASDADQSNSVVTTAHSTQKPYTQVQSNLTTTEDNPEPNSVQTESTSDPRENRRSKIKQGLRFLQSPSPWSGSTDMYKTFLNQLKAMLLEEGLELFREGSSEDAVTQISEAINISNYMRKEGIQGYSDIQDQLFLERAVIKLHMGNPAEALKDADEAYNVTRGSNQNTIRLKARLLAQCGRWDEALTFMIKCQQTQNLDTESIHLMDILKQTISGRNDANNRHVNSKGTIGDRRSRTVSQPNLSSTVVNVSEAKNFSVNQVLNGTNAKKQDVPPNPYSQTYSNFNGIYNSPIGSFLTTEGQPNHRDSRDSNNFPSLNGHNFNCSNLAAQHAISLHQNVPQEKMFAVGPLKAKQVTTPSNYNSSFFSSGLNELVGRLGQNVNDPSYYSTMWFRQLGASSGSMWNNNNSASLPTAGLKSDSSLDNELSWTLESKLKTTSANNLSFSRHQSWPDKIETTSKSTEMNIPAYSHFSSDPTKGGYTGAVLGPAMLGINTSLTNKTSAAAPVINGSIKTQYLPNGNTIKLANEALKELFSAPMQDSYDFKLGCYECVFSTGTKLLDWRYDDGLVHLCLKNVLLCRPRGNNSWFKIRPKPRDSNNAASYTLCKDLITVKGCVQGDACQSAHNKEEALFWTWEQKGFINRSWLYLCLNHIHMKGNTLVDILVHKYGGEFEFLCKTCFHNKPRVISRFREGLGPCNNISANHINSVDNRQLTHVIREGVVRYTAIRDPLLPVLCPMERILQCSSGAACNSAHSIIERDVWVVMIKDSINATDFHLQAKKATSNKTQHEKNTIHNKSTFFDSISGLRERMKFICSLCYKNAKCSEASKDTKYCVGGHSWSGTKKILLFLSSQNTWIQIRDLPYHNPKTSTSCFEICENYLRQQKCVFGANCLSAHSQEELEFWFLMKEKEIKDIDELYGVFIQDEGLPSNKCSRSQSEVNGEVQSMLHCWLCCKELTNDEWKDHCSSDLHLKRATTDSDCWWKYRKPGAYFEICVKHVKGMCEYDSWFGGENSCPFAHSYEELKEWGDRRHYVLNRVRKAKADGLLDSIAFPNNLPSLPSS